MRKYFPQGVLWCKKPEREHGARQPLPLTAAVFFACAAMPRNRAAMQKTAGAPSEAVPLFSRRRTGGEWLEPATLPTTSRLCRAIAQSAMQKQPERRARLFLCPPAAEQAANGWSPQPCPTTSRLCRAIAQSTMQKTAGAPSEDVPLYSPPPNRRRMVGARNPAPPLAGYAAQCKKDEASLMYKSSRTNSSPPQNAARRSIRR